MEKFISKLTVPSGEELINVPADAQVLVALGFTEARSLELIADAERQATLAELVEARRSAYVAEADPLFLEWQYDETPEKERVWRDKVAEIKLRFPLPDRA